MKNGILFILLFNFFGLSAQQLKTPLFVNGDRVCFVGNSITNNGEFYNFICLYYATRFPNQKLTFYNCGISGDVAGGMLKRVQSDVLIHQPTWSVLMVGMNDVRRDLYLPQSNTKPGIENERRAALDTYRKNGDTLVKILAAHSRVILEKPTIYDQTAKIKAPNAFGVNDALGTCAEIIQGLSQKYQTRLVDYRSIMMMINNKLQAADSSATITGPDRIHPLSPGHLVMAYQFLKQTNAPALVSRIVVSDGAKHTPVQSENCMVKNQRKTDKGISFDCKEYSLPFPVREDLVSVLNWLPFTNDLNQEILQVKDLKEGNYNLQIDGQPIATYPAAQFESGVNLALQKNTPQYKQAVKVMEACMKYRKTEAVIRSLKFVEVEHMAGMKSMADTALVRQYLDTELKKYTKSEHYDYYKNQFKNYLINKPKQKETEENLEKQKEMVYQVNKPVSHTFMLIRQ